MGMLVNSFIAFGGAAPPAGPYNFPIMMCSSATTGVATDTYIGLMHSFDNDWYTTTAFTQSITPVELSLANFKFVLGTAPGGGVTRTISILDDGTTTGLDAVIVDSATSATDAGPATVAAQSTLQIVTTDNGVPAASVLSRWRVDCTSENQVLLAASHFALSTSTNRYLSLMGDFASATQAVVSQVIPIAGNIKNLIVKNVTSVLTSGSFVVTLMVNGSASALTCTIDNSGVIFADATHSVAVVAGDLVAWQVDPVSPNATKAIAIGCEFECSVAGTGIIMGGSNTNASNSAAAYSWAGEGAAWDATETDVQALAQAITVTDLYVRLSAATGAGKTRTTLLRDDAAGTAVSVAISDASAVTGSWNGSVSVAVDSLICIETTPDGTPAASTVKWGLAYHT